MVNDNGPGRRAEDPVWIHLIPMEFYGTGRSDEMENPREIVEIIFWAVRTQYAALDCPWNDMTRLVLEVAPCR